MVRLRLLMTAAAAIAVLTASLPAPAAMALPAPSAFEQQQQVVRLTTGRGEPIAAVQTTPKDGININTPAIIHIHGGPGATPLDGSGPWIAEGLAGRGYTVLAPLARHGSHLFDFTFDEQNEGIKALVDYLTGVGFREVVLTGSSFGSISATRYIVDTKDPRIKATIHYAPTGDMGPDTRRRMGPEEYNRTVDELGALVSAGKGDTVVTRIFTHEAETWLDHWGPASDGVNSLLFDKIGVPILLAVGDEDPFGDEPRMQALKAAATRSPKVDYIIYRGGVDHSFYPKPNHAKVVADTVDWLQQIGMGPQPRTRMQIVTNHDDNKPGMQRALMYWPQGDAAGKPAFVFVNDWDGDALSGPNDRLASAVAARGYPALVMQTQRGGYTTGSSFETNRSDVKGWIDWLEGQGVGKVVLAGPGMGASRVVDYAAQSGDGRVAGLVLVSPRPDNAAWMKAAVGPQRYAQMVSQAQAAPKPVEKPGPVGASSVPFMQFEAEGGERFVLTPAAFLRTFGPDAPVTSRQLAKVRAPVLLAAGADNGLMDRQAFTALGGGGRQVKWREEKVGRDFSGYEAELARDIVEWAPK
jgi:dienelactone hydrolase